jgi:hypothetical protein
MTDTPLADAPAICDARCMALKDAISFGGPLPIVRVATQAEPRDHSNPNAKISAT